MPPRKKKVPKRKVAQKQKQKQSVVVNINQQRKTTIRRQPATPKPSPTISPVFQFPQQPDNISSIISAIQGLNRQQGNVIRDVVKVDVAEERALPEQVRQQRLRVLETTPQYQGLSSEEVESSSGYESLPESLPIARKKTKRLKLNIVKVPVSSVNVLPTIQEAVREEELKKPPPLPFISRSESQFERLLREVDEPQPFPSRIRERVESARLPVEVREVNDDEAFRERVKQHNRGLKRDDPNFIRLHVKLNENTGSNKKKTIQELRQEARDKGLDFLFLQTEAQPVETPVEPFEPVGFSFQSPQSLSFQDLPPPPERLVGGGGAEGGLYEPFKPEREITSTEQPRRTISDVLTEKPKKPTTLYDREQSLLKQKITEQQQGKDTSDIDAELLKISNLKLKQQPRRFSTQLSFESGAPVVREEVPEGSLPRTQPELVSLPSGEPLFVRRLKVKEPEPLFVGVSGGEEI